MGLIPKFKSLMLRTSTQKLLIACRHLSQVECEGSACIANDLFESWTVR